MVQVGLVGLIGISTFSLTLSIPLFTVIVLYLSNLPYGLYASKFEKKMLFLAPMIASMRSIVGVMGAVWGVIRLR